MSHCTSQQSFLIIDLLLLLKKCKRGKIFEETVHKYFLLIKGQTIEGVVCRTDMPQMSDLRLYK